jgi:hypothetical protein
MEHYGIRMIRTGIEMRRRSNSRVITENLNAELSEVENKNQNLKKDIPK